MHQQTDQHSNGKHVPTVSFMLPAVQAYPPLLMFAGLSSDFSLRASRDFRAFKFAASGV